jgi:hypothetical protein
MTFEKYLLAMTVVPFVLISLSKMGAPKCRNCGVRILPHTIHKCPVNGRRYTAR